MGNMKISSYKMKNKVPSFKTSKLKRLNGEKKKGATKKDMKVSSTSPTKRVSTSSKDMQKNVAVKSPSSTHHKHISLPFDSQHYSTNWKQLLSSLPKRSDKVFTHKNPSNSLTSKDNRLYRKKFLQNEKKNTQIWFDDIDKTFIELESNNAKSSILSQNSDKPKPTTINFVPKEHSTVANRSSEYIALDCEMVGTGDNGKDNMLARVSLVNQHGCCVYDKFVKPRESITDYRTAVSGITPEKVENGATFKIVQKEVSDLINGKILVGHAVTNDLKVLFLDHPRKKIRDTSRYKPFRKLFDGRTPSLKNLTRNFLGIEIQDGSHNSVIDAQAAMKIFLMHKKEWEKQYSTFKKKLWKKY